MPELTVRTGHDTFLLEASPANSSNARARFLQIRSGDELIPALYMPVNATRIAGKTINSAILSVPVDEDWVTQNVTIQAFDAEWKVARITWNNQPAVAGPTASSGATGALSAGDRFEIDITALVQNIADGDPNYGWKLTTSQSTTASKIRGFDSGYSSFTLTVDYVDRPDAPTQLAPEGVIGIDKWVVTVDETGEYGTALSEIQVQIDATPAPSNADYDTDWVATTRPKLDLSDTFPLGTAGGVGDTTYNGLSDGATTYWRARVKLLDGGESLWSPWAEVTRDAKPSIVDDTGTTIYDPTPEFEAHLSPAGDANTRWQVIISEVGDPSNVFYNSGDDIEGATLAHQVPLRNYKGKLVFPDDGTYRREIRAWDRTDRASSQGDLPYARLIDTITLNADGALDEPTLAVAMATPTGEIPRPRLTITDLGTSEWVVVRRDGKFLTSFLFDDFTTGAETVVWDDESALPNTEHTYVARGGTAASGTRRISPNSNAVAITTTLTGVWLRSDLGDLLLYGDQIDAAQIDRRQTFERPYNGEPLDIVTAIGGIEGTATLTLDRRADDLPEAVAMIEELRDIPHAEVRLVWGTHNIWVNLRGLSVTMSQGSLFPSSPTYDVRFGFFEIDPVD